MYESLLKNTNGGVKHDICDDVLRCIADIMKEYYKENPVEFNNVNHRITSPFEWVYIDSRIHADSDFQKWCMFWEDKFKPLIKLFEKIKGYNVKYIKQKADCKFEIHFINKKNISF